MIAALILLAYMAILAFAWAHSALTLPMVLGAGIVTLAAQVCAFVYTLIKEPQP